jgi:hypothetical protein
MTSRIIKLLLVSVILLSTAVSAGQWQGKIAFESRFFTDDALLGQDNEQFSLLLEPEFYQTFDDGSVFTFKAMYREDSMDDNRSHGDLRELSYILVGEQWEMRLGISKVFWGVAESKHLVDIINQTDILENIDGEDKYGQPMVNLTLLKDWGTLDFFVLPYFVERQFPSLDGRLTAPININESDAQFASGAGQHRIDSAIRWSHTFDEWDMGIAHFSGTSREPILRPALNGFQLELQPLYTTIDQTSLDLQATFDNWLWKLEMISNSGFDIGRYTAAVGGLEYSFYDISESGIDIGMIVEYQFDDRKVDIMGAQTNNALVVGARVAFNDTQSTELLLGVSAFEKTGDQFWNLEASRRIGDSWKLTLEARIIDNVDQLQSPFYGIRNDSFVMLELAKYY